MDDKENKDPKNDQPSANESFKVEQDKAQWGKEQQEKVQWDTLQPEMLQGDKVLQPEEAQSESVAWTTIVGEIGLPSQAATSPAVPSPTYYQRPDPLELLRKIGLDWRPEKEQPPDDPVFENAHSGMRNRASGSSANAPDGERMSKLLEAIPDLQNQYVQRGRAECFYPYLLIRTVVGERGDRPLNPSTQPTASPDIWIAPGEPDSNPEMPVTMDGETPLEPLWWNPSYSIAPRAHGFNTNFLAGQPHTVYAHVWNLGRAPIIGVKVDFVYSWTSFYDEMPDKHQSFGFARIDLAPRSSRHCHRLVKCPQPLYLKRTISGGEQEAETQMIVVRVSCIGDGITDPWMPLNDRHVAFHFLNVTDFS